MTASSLLVRPSASQSQAVRDFDELVIFCKPVVFWTLSMTASSLLVRPSASQPQALRDFDELVIFCKPVGFLGPCPCDDSLVSFAETVSFLCYGLSRFWCSLFMNLVIHFCGPQVFLTQTLQQFRINSSYCHAFVNESTSKTECCLSGLKPKNKYCCKNQSK